MIWSKCAELVGSEALEVAGWLGILMQVMCSEVIETHNKVVIRIGKRDGEEKHVSIHHCVCTQGKGNPGKPRRH